jgi:hypothetical protein
MRPGLSLVLMVFLAPVLIRLAMWFVGKYGRPSSRGPL